MSRTRTCTSLLLAALLLAGCQPAADPAPATAAAQAPPPAAAAETAPATDATLVSDETSPAAATPAFDVRAFAGRFEGTLPCADCPGIDSRLQLHVDGRYALHDHYRERDVDVETNGTWTVEDSGRRLRLDPDDKSGQDRLHAIVSNDELRMLDADGQPLDTNLDFSLRRSDAR